MFYKTYGWDYDNRLVEESVYMIVLLYMSISPYMDYKAIAKLQVLNGHAHL
jgi:hypothetical protein